MSWIKAFCAITVFIIAFSFCELIADVIFPALAEKTLAEKIVEWPK